MAGLSLDGRTAVVTGATGGLGKAIARALVARGARLLVSARRADALEQMAGELGGDVEACVADLSRRDDVQRLAERSAGADVLVANAGLPASGRLDDYSEEQVDRAIDVNLRAPVQLARALAPRMVERGAGHLVFISSVSGKMATANSSLYAATKYGLRGFAAGLREDLWGSGVGVTVVFPGLIRDAGMFADTGLSVPMGAGTRSPDEVAAAVLRGIERNRGEIDVAPPQTRAWVRLNGVSPRLVAWVNRRAGAARIAGEFAERQREKR